MVVGSHLVITLHVQRPREWRRCRSACWGVHPNVLCAYASAVTHSRRTLAMPLPLRRTGMNYVLETMEVVTYEPVAAAVIVGWLQRPVLPVFVTAPVAVRQVRRVFRRNRAVGLDGVSF